jgi:DNA repair protein RadC
MRVKLARTQRIRVLNSDDVYKVMQQILLRENKIDRSKEHFWVVCLSQSNMILLIELVSLGTMKQSLVDPTEVFSFGLQKRASQLIMVHNHPGGTMKPSDADIELTDRLYQVGLIVDLPVIDHIIITERKHYSFLDSGLLDKIAKSEKYVIKYKKEEARIKKEAEKIGHERGREEGIEVGERRGELKKAFEMAKVMKEDGKTDEEIMRYTKLTKRQIERL